LLKEKMQRDHAISQAFVFLLLGIFAVFSTLIVLLGAQLYREIVDQTDIHNSRRVLYSYVSNAVRGNDATNTIHTEKIGDVDMLVFDWVVDDECYETYIYCYEGTLRELFTSQDQEFDPDYGEVICEANAFRPVLSDGLLEIYVEDAGGQARTLHMALNCAGEETL